MPGARRPLLGALMAAAVAAGCSEAVLNNAPEAQANRAIGVLQDQGISAAKEPDNPEARTYKVVVPYRDRVRAIGVLNTFKVARPVERRLGDIYGRNSLVMSPLEEKALFLEATQGEINHTLESISGIVSSRVHVAFPETDLAGQTRGEAKASVMIEYRGDQAPVRPDEVQRLVASAVADLKPESVNVVMKPIELVSSTQAYEFVAFGPVIVAKQSLFPLKMLTGLIVLAFTALGASLYWNGRVMNELRFQLQGAQRHARSLQRPPKPAA